MVNLAMPEKKQMSTICKIKEIIMITKLIKITRRMTTLFGPVIRSIEKHSLPHFQLKKLNCFHPKPLNGNEANILVKLQMMV